jgi:hypothetical protein
MILLVRFTGDDMSEMCLRRQHAANIGETAAFDERDLEAFGAAVVNITSRSAGVAPGSTS